MARLRRIHLVPLAALALAAGLPAAAAAPAAAATTYTITNLGNLGSGGTDAVAINNNGQVTGQSDTTTTITITHTCGYGKHRHTCTETENTSHAFVWSNGTMTDLGTLGGDFSAAAAINGSGEVVGWSQTSTSSDAQDQFLWSNGTMTDLTTTALSGLSGAIVAGINNSGQLAGNDGQGPFLDSNGTITQLPLPNYGPNTPNGSTSCSAQAINNNGVVLGGCNDPSSDSHAVIWQNGTVTDLGTLGGPQAEAAGINNLGQVVGFAQTSTDADHGFLWSNGKMTDLGLNVFPAAINDNDVILAGDEIYSGGTWQNLNNLIPANSGYTITSAVAINDNGQIVAQDGGTALLLTPN